MGVGDVDVDVDVVVVGSGITGAGVAWGLLKGDGGKKKRVVMLEARSVCSGATGRNGVLFPIPIPIPVPIL